MPSRALVKIDEKIRDLMWDAIYEVFKEDGLEAMDAEIETDNECCTIAKKVFKLKIKNVKKYLIEDCGWDIETAEELMIFLRLKKKGK